MDAPQAKNVTKLKSFLGMLNYYTMGSFYQTSQHNWPLCYSLLKKNSRWSCGAEQRNAFKKAKSMLTSLCVLTHFDLSKPLILACDVSPYRVGAVLSHQVGEDDLPIAFNSNSTE